MIASFLDAVVLWRAIERWPVTTVLSSIIVLIIGVLFSTYTYTLYRFRVATSKRRDLSTEPPKLPYAVPWLGHALHMITNTRSCFASLRYTKRHLIVSVDHKLIEVQVATQRWNTRHHPPGSAVGLHRHSSSPRRGGSKEFALPLL